MAKQDLKGSTEEREAFMYSIFEQHYSDPKKAKKDLSVNKANEQFKAKYGTMLRNKKAYQLRAACKAKLGLLKGKKAQEAAKNAPAGAKPVTEAARPAQGAPTAEVAQKATERGAKLITGTPEQLQWLKDQVLPDLADAGLLDGRLDYATDKYAVVAPH